MIKRALVEHFFVLGVQQLRRLIFWLLLLAVDEAQYVEIFPLKPHFLPLQVLVQLLLVLFDHFTSTINLLQH